MKWAGQITLLLYSLYKRMVTDCQNVRSKQQRVANEGEERGRDGKIAFDETWAAWVAAWEGLT